jgi:nucleoside-diphosphate-sugar epimerase
LAGLPAQRNAFWTREKAMGMVSLVTGAAGFIGSHVVDELLSRGSPVRAFVRPGRTRFSWPGSQCEIVEGDLRDPAQVRAALEQVDVVFHCAAAAGNSPRQNLEHDLSCVRNLLDAAPVCGVRRIVLVTGLSVLGLVNMDGATEDWPRRRSYDPELQTKVLVEETASAEKDIEVVLIRTGFVYGPRDRRNWPRLAEAVRGGSFLYIGSRRNVLPLVYVTDMADAIVRAGRTPAAAGRVYHITDGTRTTLGDFMIELAELLGVKAPTWTLPYFLPGIGCWFCRWARRLLYVPIPEPISRSTLLFLGTSRHISIDRAREELGFAPQVGYKEGLARAIRWLNEQHHEVPVTFLAPA